MLFRNLLHTARDIIQWRNKNPLFFISLKKDLRWPDGGPGWLGCRPRTAALPVWPWAFVTCHSSSSSLLSFFLSASVHFILDQPSAGVLHVQQFIKLDSYPVHHCLNLPTSKLNHINRLNTTITTPALFDTHLHPCAAIFSCWPLPRWGLAHWQCWIYLRWNRSHHSPAFLSLSVTVFYSLCSCFTHTKSSFNAFCNQRPEG